MNVMFIEIASDGTIGGSHTCMYNLVSHLDKKSYKCHVAFYQANAYVEKYRQIGIPVHLINRKPVTYGNVLIRKMRNWYNLIYRHRKQLSDIIRENRINLVVLNNTIKNSFDIIYICKKRHIPVISYERGNLDYSTLDINLTNRIFMAIAVSKAIEKNMVSQKYNSIIHVIYDGLPIYELQISKEKSYVSKIKHSIDVPDDSIVVGIVGNIRWWKGQEYFVRAFMSLGEMYNNIYGLVIGGYGQEDEEYLKNLKNIAESSDVGKRLKFLGFRDDVPALLKIFDVFVHASITPEPFGMVLLEAMLHGVPVIATDMGGPVEILENGRYGILVPPGDSEAIVDGVEKYLHDSPYREAVIERAQKRVHEVFDLRRTVELVEKLFAEAVPAPTALETYKLNE